MKEKVNMHTFFICLDLCVFSVLLLLESCVGVDYRYESCFPKKCSNGPSIRFPFYIKGQQESYCGYPGFALNCGQSNGFPVLQLNENKFIVEDIDYGNKSVRLYNSAVLARSNCVSIKNTTLPQPLFRFARNVTELHFFSNCTYSFSEDPSSEMVKCDENRDTWELPLYDKDEKYRDALGNCTVHVVAPVEHQIKNVSEALRKGFELNWTASDCSECEESGGHCGFNVTTYHFKCFCHDRPHSSSCKPEKHRWGAILAAGISGGGVFLVLCLFSFVLWKHKKKNKIPYLGSKNISSDPLDIEDGSCYYGIPVFSQMELEKATNSFDSSKELGDGGFGTVYYGKLQDGREVAVKRLYEQNSRRVEQFMNEIKILTCLRHKNLVSLYGCTSRRSKELLLIYEYIPNGTVADHLHGETAIKAPLTWPIRMKIAMETAAALAYLHKSDIIHRDVKTTNILLDNNFCVKVADFGLSRLLPNDVTHVSTAPQGTPGYVDPEYHQCYQLTDKSDVYSFGVVLVELISSMPAVDISRHRHEVNLANLAVDRIQRRAFDELIDSSFGYGTDEEVTRMTVSVAELAFWCLQLEKDMRPSMDEVVEFLQGIQRGEEGKSEKIKEGVNNGESSFSPETDNVILLKSKYFQPSPNAVTDVWISSSSTTTTSSLV